MSRDEREALAYWASVDEEFYAKAVREEMEHDEAIQVRANS